MSEQDGHLGISCGSCMDRERQRGRWQRVGPGRGGAQRQGSGVDEVRARILDGFRVGDREPSAWILVGVSSPLRLAATGVPSRCSSGP